MKNSPPYDQVIVGADHGGWHIKQGILTWLHERSDMVQSVVDVGAFALDPEDDYPMYAESVARLVGQASQQKVTDPPIVMGVMLCRTGSGMLVVANRFLGVRAVLAHSSEAVEQGRRHINANVLVLEGDSTSPLQAQAYIELFLATPFDGERHVRRLLSFADLGTHAV